MDNRREKGEQYDVIFRVDEYNVCSLTRLSEPFFFGAGSEVGSNNGVELRVCILFKLYYLDLFQIQLIERANSD